MTILITGNTYPIKDYIKSLGGRWDPDAKGWNVPDSHADAIRAMMPAPKPVQADVQIGSMAGAIALFDTAIKHLKFPAIVLKGPDDAIRLTIAGQRARIPGSVTVTSYEQRDGDGRRLWYGRILRDGTFQPSREADTASLLPYLARFAADPATVAAEHGKATGRCCFCNKKIGEGKDDRSAAVGYGPECAKHFGVPWGEHLDLTAAA
jgi:hypothetical protein